MIGVIDYGMGNLRSVQKAFERLGFEARIMESPDAGDGLNGIEKLVLPGVGAFADGMKHLNQRGWIEPIKQFAASGKPMLGICLGMQLFFQGSQEDAPAPDQPVPGLGLLAGQVVQFRIEDWPAKQGAAAPDTQTQAVGSTVAVRQRMKVPHMGWNAITWQRDDPLFNGLSQGCYVYFVHSYYPVPQDSADRPIQSAACEYGNSFCASIWRDNLWATQFHPEKSQKIGLTMLFNFANLAQGA